MIEPPPPADEAPDTRLRRLRMRSWRRGMREMDLLLGPFADGELVGLEPAALDAYEALLSENDQDLYPWMRGARDAAEHLDNRPYCGLSSDRLTPDGLRTLNEL